MQFVIRRGASVNTLTITDNGQTHTFALNDMKECRGMPLGKKLKDADGKEIGQREVLPMGRSYRPILPPALREMVVDAWAVANGFTPIYSIEQQAA